MTRERLERLAAALRRLAWPLRSRLGGAGLLGLVLLALAAALAAWHGSQQPALAAERQALQREARALAAQAVAPARERPRSAEQALAVLPAPRDHAADLRVLFAVAARHGLAIERSDYQLVSSADGPLVVVAATLPMRGTYASLKAYADDVLRQLPHVALLDLRLERPDIGASELRARIRVSMYYRRVDP